MKKPQVKIPTAGISLLRISSEGSTIRTSMLILFWN